MKSIVLKELQEEITRILNTTYASITSIYITNELLKKELNKKKLLDIYPNAYPYSYFNIDIDKFSKSYSLYEREIFENCIVNLIVAIENFCYNALERYYILNIDKLSNEKSSLVFNEISEYIKNSQIEIGLCKILAERKLRGSTTYEMLKKLGDITENGFLKKSGGSIEKITKYSLVRNCIIHNQSRVTRDVIKEYNDEFGLINEHIAITHEMCVDLSQNILKATKNFDKHYSEKIIKNHDAIALIKEYYFVYEENDISKYRSMIFKILNKKVDKEIIQQSLSQLKNNKGDVSFDQISEKANRLVTNYNKQA